MNVLGWRIDWGEPLIKDLRLQRHRGSASLYVCATLPRLMLWRAPRTVLWGGGKWDVQVGSEQDWAREAYLNEWALRHRALVTVTFRLRDSLTPKFAEMAEAFEHLTRAAGLAGARVQEFGEAFERGQRGRRR